MRQRVKMVAKISLIGVCFSGILMAGSGVSPERMEEWLKESNTTCPIKFVDTSRYPKWRAVILYKDNQKEFFSSPKSMLHYFYTQSYRNFSGVQALYVTDYETGGLIESSEAYYVFGSRIVSMSGDDLIPFGTRESAEKFAKEHSGKRIFEFKEVTKKLVDYLEIR